MTTNRLSQMFVLLVSLSALVSLSVFAQDFGQVEIKTTKISDNIYMLEGAGGTMAVAVGDDGVILIDDDFTPLTEKIKAAIAEITDQPIKFLLNTHWHPDHVGGNEAHGEAGALIFAHHNVRERMSKKGFIEFFQNATEPFPDGALPVVTFGANMTFHLNDEEVRLIHVAHAHTDGDAIVHFPKSDVIHAGDLYFSGTYPFVDLSSDGSFDGFIAGTKMILELAGENTKIIAGHGPLTGKTEFSAYHEMIVTIVDRVYHAVADGQSLEEIQAAKPTAEFDAEWGDGYVNPEQLVDAIYRSCRMK